MSDAIIRLLFNTYDFDKNVQRAKSSVGSFESGIIKAAGVIGKFAGAIGVAMSASEVFNKTIHSSQQLGDDFDNTINAAKGTIDAFFQSLSNGNWDVFQDGILSTIGKMKELSALRDSLADAKLSMGFNTKIFEKDFARLESIIDDATKPKPEREKAFEELKTLISEFQKDVEDTAVGSENTLLTSLNARFGRKDFNISDINKYIAISNNDFSTRKEKKELVEYQKQLKEYEKTIRQIEGRINSTRGDVNEFTGETKRQMREQLNETKNQLDNFKKQNAELEKQNILNNDNDEARKLMIQDYEYVLELQQKGSEFQKRSLEKQNTILNLKKNEKNGKDEIIPPGSLAELNKQINDTQKKYADAASDAARQAALKTLEELKNKKITIEFQTKFPKAPKEVKEGEGRGNLLSYAKISEKIPKKINPIERKDIKINEEYAESLGYIGDAFGSMSSMADGAVGSILSYFGNLMTSVAAAIPAIDALNTKKKEESAANTEAAVTGAASSVASIPFVGAALAVAAIASVLAALANVPRYATGGIVGGSSFFGDNMIARVNSGEMILNQSQQGKLFSMINNGGSSNHVTVDGEVSVKGKVMYIAIKNYMKANNIKW